METRQQQTEIEINDKPTDEERGEKPLPKYKPPPITISGIADINVFYERIKHLENNDGPIIKTLNGGDVKILTKTEETHCNVLKILRKM